jgi:hypothetical protein
LLAAIFAGFAKHRAHDLCHDGSKQKPRATGPAGRKCDRKSLLKKAVQMSTLLRALKTTGNAALWVGILLFLVLRAPSYEHPFAFFGSMVLTVIAVDMAFSFVTVFCSGLARYLARHQAG